MTSTTNAVTTAKVSNPASGSTVVAGQTLTYTVTATVTGAATVAPIVLTDTLSAGLTFGSVTVPGIYTPGGAGQVRTFTMPAGTVAGTYAVTYTATVNASASGVVNNAVTGADGCTPSATCTTSHPVGSVAIAKALVSESGAQPGIAEANETLTYSITLTNPSAVAVTGYNLAASDQFTLVATGSSGTSTVTTTGSNNTPNEAAVLTGVNAGQVYTLSEAPAGGALGSDYTSTYSCTNALGGGQTPSGSGTSFNVTPGATDDLTCVFSNVALPRADLAVSKTANPTTVAPGGVVTFTLTVDNNGPSAANGAVLRDVAGAGLNCTTPSTTATCSASGGAACSGATVPLANLLGSGGVGIPTLPVGGRVVLTMQCTVTATGVP